MNTKLSAKLIASHLLLGIIPLLLVSGLLWALALNRLEKVGQEGAAAVEHAAYDQLKTMCRIKERQLLSFFSGMEGQLQMVKEQPWVMEAITSFSALSSARPDNSAGLQSWQSLVERYDGLFRSLCLNLDWRDLFLINAKGDIVYSMNKQTDMGLSLNKEPLLHSSFGKAFAELQKNQRLELAFGDFAPYAPLRSSPEAFLITRIKEKGKEEDAAYLAVQVSKDAIRKIMESAADKAQTLEAYLVGADGCMRSDSILNPGFYSMAASFSQGAKVLTEAVQNALNGSSSSGLIEDYRGKRVLSSWSPVDIFGARWALVCEVDEAAALAARTAMRETTAQAGRKLITCGTAALLFTIFSMAMFAWQIARSVSRPIKYAANIADLMASGDFSQRLHMRRKDEIGQMAAALDHMAERVAVNLWHKSGIAELAEIMRGKTDLQSMASSVASCLAKQLGAQMASLYLADKKGEHLILTGSYAFHRRRGINSRIQLGEGLAGQAALERNIISAADLPDNYFRISSTLGEAVPRCVLAAPFVHEDRLMGVLEFAAFKEFSDDEMEFLRNVLESVAMAFASVQSRQMQELLEKTQLQAEELKQHGEELLAANERLEAQSAELRAMQAELEASNVDLEEKSEALAAQNREIEQSNAELINTREELEKHSKELARSSKYKSEFLANMSHELRTPMNSLLLLAQSLSSNRDGNLTPQQQQSAEIIVESGKDLLNIIDEILDLAKIEAGRVRKQIGEVVLTDLADNIQALFIHMAAAKGIAFRVSIEPSLPPRMFTDRSRLEQILKNFIGNSLKFTEQGGEIALAIGWPQPDEQFRAPGLVPEKSIAFSVSDTGIGISADKQQIIFEAFQQADGSTARKYGGTGLGLSISKELAALLGGEIHLNSEPGMGAVFILFLPIDGRTAEEQEQQENAANRRLQQPAAGGKTQQPAWAIADDRSVLADGEKSMLLIEDDPFFAQFLLQQCHEYGFKALAAASGEEGLELADNCQPTGIVLDLRLPGIDGWTVLNSLKENPRTRHIPVHIISADEVSSEAFKLGAIGFLTKPADQEQLRQAFGRFEAVISRRIKKLLVAEDDAALRAAVIDLVSSSDTETIAAATGKEVKELLTAQRFDCMILDIGLPDCSGIELLRQLSEDLSLAVPPVIIYTGRELSREEERELNKYSESIIIKNAHSKERLLDETSLFLHRIADAPAKDSDAAAGRQDRSGLLKGKRVLLVDDDMRNVFALSNALEERGMRVLVAEDGRQALEALDQCPDVDLVLMDIMMPDLDGYETTKRIRQQPRFANLPVIALTAKAMKEDRQKCIDAGASDYMAKPIDLERLLSMMRVWLHQK